MELSGSIVALVTPFRDGRVDEAALRSLIDWQIAEGTSAIVPCGTTGESATLSHAEHVDVIKMTVDAVAGRVPVVAGTGSNSTREAIDLTVGAQKAGAQAALLITPYYNKPTQEGLFAHYSAVARETDLPLVVYNCPGRTGVSIAPDTIRRLAEAYPRICAVKDATVNLDWTSEVCRIPGLTVLSGDDSAAVAQVALGARGVISVLANVAPRATAEMMHRALTGDFHAARVLHHRYYPLMKALFMETSPIPVKAALEMMGKIGPEIRLPLVPMTDAGRARLRAILTELALL